MESISEVKVSPAGVHWARLVAPLCVVCGLALNFKYHSNPRKVIINSLPVQVIFCYYECRNPHCPNHGVAVPARHPEVIPRKKYSKSTYARVAYLKHVKQYTVQQILDLVPGLTQASCYEILHSFAAACRAMADERLAAKYPPGTKIRVSMDAMEPEKGQPALWSVREVTNGDLFAADFIGDASAEALRDLVHGVEEKYGVTIVGLLSDKQKNIVAMHDKYFPHVPHQYCGFHVRQANYAIECRTYSKGQVETAA